MNSFGTVESCVNLLTTSILCKDISMFTNWVRYGVARFSFRRWERREIER